MSDKIFNILWIDDQHEELPALHRTAKDYNIKLFPYKSMNGGCGEIEKNYNLYDAVLLDAKFFENENDIQGSEDTKWVHRAKERILQLPKKFEYFVLTGQAKTYASQEFNNAFPNVYEKGVSAAEDELFSSLVIAANKQTDTQIRHKYQRVFDVCTEKYIGEYAGQDLLNLLKVEDETNIDNHFNAIRKIVEDLFLAFHKFDLLPSEYVNPNISLNQSSIFLAGQEQNEKTDAVYKQHKHLKNTHLPSQIAYYMRSILAISQSGSHRSNIDLHVHTLKTPFLLRSVLYQLLDVLVWFKMYVDSNPKTENWERIDSLNEVSETETDILIHGKVINVNLQKGFAFFEPNAIGDNVFIPPHLVSEYSLHDEMSIQVKTEEYTDNRSGELKTRVKRIEKN